MTNIIIWFYGLGPISHSATESANYADYFTLRSLTPELLIRAALHFVRPLTLGFRRHIWTIRVVRVEWEPWTQSNKSDRELMEWRGKLLRPDLSYLWTWYFCCWDLEIFLLSLFVIFSRFTLVEVVVVKVPCDSVGSGYFVCGSFSCGSCTLYIVQCTMYIVQSVFYTYQYHWI